ncbi:hypothetical protein JQ604_12390 [Bradyrhizobium jicamae]|uniref:hypothetical protein n=1 Tax=Bradyrhizobium jicamae TaxID=280332 RepID=UPI001BAD9045|nr:hypothetical protein [Bradyrhizobium jicamae]MBR0752986.1 hypothetical protein [Bradyrhizobium jicamae]
MRSATAQRVDTMILINRMRQLCMPHVRHAESWGIRAANPRKIGKNRHQSAMRSRFGSLFLSMTFSENRFTLFRIMLWRLQKIPLWREAGAG